LEHGTQMGNRVQVLPPHLRSDPRTEILHPEFAENSKNIDERDRALLVHQEKVAQT
jgi:hypothetical protein